MAFVSACERSPPSGAHTQGLSTDVATLGGIQSIRLPDRSPSPGPLFEALSAKSSGVDFVTPLTADQARAYLNVNAFVASGVCVGDLDGDDLPELFFAGGLGPNRLFKNRGGMRFEEVKSAGITGGDAWAAGAAMADIDGDGDLDIYVCNYDSPNQLFLNDSSGGLFVEAAARFGIDWNDASLMPSFVDYDADGDLDLFVLTYRYFRPGGRPKKPPVGKKATGKDAGKPYVLPEFSKYYALRRVSDKRYTVDVCGRPDRLFRNDGQHFVEIGAQSGIREAGHGFSATWWDYDRDGDVDLYVGNDFTDADHLYRNRGDGTFEDVIADVMPYTTWSSMGADCGDLDGDGRLDLMCADMAATTHYKAKISMGEMGDRRWLLENAWPRQAMRNTAFLATDADRFLEVAYLAGLAGTDWTWSVKLEDYDQDGRIDVFVTNGMSRRSNDADVPITPEMLIGHTEWELWKGKKRLVERNMAFRNRGDLSFSKVGSDWGLDHEGMSLASAYGDLDRDGDVDLVVVHLDEPAVIYRNRSASGHRIVVRLRGTRSHASGIGAVVSIESALGPQVRQLQPSTGFMSGNDTDLHFGLGEDDTVRKLGVHWPRGAVQEFENLAADRLYTVTEPSAPRKLSPQDPEVRARFEEVSARTGPEFRHRETKFDDYARQPLLPGKHSQLGPGLAWGDADGDGDDDLYVGGAAGQAGVLYLQSGSGLRPSADARAVFDADRAHEDMSPLWLDVDGDGDQDLVVTSGSSEFPEGDPRLADRLYIADGGGSFRRADENQFPGATVSSGPAVAGDVDGDGDLDLFIGGRVIPGRYPESPASRLLVNDGGQFVDRTDELAPELRRAGLVTSALFSDANGDRQIDLLLTLEWGSVRLFANVDGRLEDRSSIAGLAGRKGWWNSITGADIDGDGDSDYIVLNVGLNTKYGAPSAKKPAVLYYGDMEGDGVRRLVEAKPDSRGLVPVRGRSCSSHAMPMLGEKFPTYRKFASALLPEIYTEQCLARARRYEANTFESGILLGDGQGSFEWRPFPRRAQISPGYGVVAGDFDGDRRIEIYAAQNFYTREPETGLWRGGLGLALEWDGQGFRHLLPGASGFVVSGDGVGLARGDLDGDGLPDLVATVNDSPCVAFRNMAAAKRLLQVKLRGPAGNPLGVGARVRVDYQDGGAQSAEIYAGGGYLSQSTATQYFASEGAQKVTVLWPDGKTTERPVTSGLMVIER